MVQPTTAFCAYSLAKMVHARRAPPPRLQSHEMMYVVMIGCVQGFEIGLTNKALEYLSVAARTMISSMNVLFMMCTARLWGLERLGFLRFLSSLLMICGGLAQCQPGSKSTSQWGFFFQLISMLLSSQRWAMAQKVLQSPEGSALRRTSKLQLLARTLPITGAICMVLALIFEPGALGFLSATAAPVLAQNVLIVAVGLTAMLYAELKLASSSPWRSGRSRCQSSGRLPESSGAMCSSASSRQSWAANGSRPLRRNHSSTRRCVLLLATGALLRVDILARCCYPELRPCKSSHPSNHV
ncbi:unnamed protein product [Effrenium voratum]|nr:unnamed protein product [Effrenium voratum]